MAAQWVHVGPEEEEYFDQPLPAPTSSSLPSRESSASPRKTRSRLCLETVCEEEQECVSPAPAATSFSRCQSDEKEEQPELQSPLAAASGCCSEDVIIQVDAEDKHVELKRLQSPLAAGIHTWCQSIPSPAKSPSSRPGLKSEMQDFMAVCPQGPVRSPSARSPVSQASGQSAAHSTTSRSNGCMQRMVSLYVKRGPGHRPCLCACSCLLASVAIIALGIIALPPEVDTDFAGFMKTDVQASSRRDSFLEALKHRSDDGRRLSGGLNLYTTFEVALGYELKPEAQLDSILSPAAVTQIALLEQKVKSAPGWIKQCNNTYDKYRPLCSNGVSAINFAMPQLLVPHHQVIPSSIDFNGKGSMQLPVEAVLNVIEARQLEDTVLPKGYDRKSKSITHLRSAFRFEQLCCTSTDAAAYRKGQVRSANAQWKAYLQDELLPMLQTMASEINSDSSVPVALYFEGSGFQSFEIMQALLGDLRLAGASLVFVLLYVSLHTGSCFISCLGMLVVTLAVPLSYVVCALITGSQTITIASFLSVFLVVGLGSDVIFVYSDFWKNSAKESHDVQARLIWTYTHAGKASLATTATTAVSFFANLASVLKPLREFGFFMGLCVMLAWMLLSAIVVPLCVIDEQRFQACNLRRCMGCNRRLHEKDTRDSSLRACIDWWTCGLFRWRRTFVLLWILVTIAAATSTGMSLQVSTGLPNIFPDGHNQNRGREVMHAFAPLKDSLKQFAVPEPSDASLCNEKGFSDSASQNCPMYWCDAKPSPAVDVDTCQCYTKTAIQASASSLTLRLFHASLLDTSTLGDLVGNSLINSTDISWNGLPPLAVRRPPLLLQEWETGATETASTIDFTLKLNSAASNAAEQLCFCGSLACKLPSSWIQSASLHLTHEGGSVLTTALSNGRQLAVTASEGGSVLTTALSNGRRLAVATPSSRTWRVPSNLRATVDVSFGILVSGSSPFLGDVNPASLWRFDDMYDMRQPWAQRSLLAFCTELPERLRVGARRCWIERFREYLGDGGRFPARPVDFDREVISFSDSTLTGRQPSGRYIWWRDQEIKASYMSFDIDVSRFAGTREALQHKQYWDEYIADWMNAAEEYGLHFGKGPWHSSSLWVRAEAQERLISSTVITLVTALVLGFLGMLACTGDPFLAVMVTMSSLGVVVGLAFFMVVVMGWEIGPIEVIALIVFIGYAVTYSLHVAHGYGTAAEGKKASDEPHTEERLPLVAAALEALGGAALGSAATTAGCALFLIFCTLTIFQRLGVVVMVVTLFSIVTAWFLLPAALLWFGPRKPGCLRNMWFGSLDVPGEGPSSAVTSRTITVSGEADPPVASWMSGAQGKRLPPSPRCDDSEVVVLATSPVVGSGVPALDRAAAALSQSPSSSSSSSHRSRASPTAAAGAISTQCSSSGGIAGASSPLSSAAATPGPPGRWQSQFSIASEAELQKIPAVDVGNRRHSGPPL